MTARTDTPTRTDAARTDTPTRTEAARPATTGTARTAQPTAPRAEVADPAPAKDNRPGQGRGDQAAATSGGRSDTPANQQPTPRDGQGAPRDRDPVRDGQPGRDAQSTRDTQRQPGQTPPHPDATRQDGQTARPGGRKRTDDAVTPQDAAAVLIATAFAADAPGMTRDAGTVHATSDGSPHPVIPSYSTTWRQRRNGAPPTRYHAERFDPLKNPGQANGRLGGRITQIRFDVRRFEVEPGKWVRELSVPLDLLSENGSVSRDDRFALVDELQDRLDKHFNFKEKHRFPNGDQLHFSIDARAVEEKAPNWDRDPAKRVPVDTFDSSRPKETRETDQVQWDVRDSVKNLLHELFHFWGLGEGYRDKSLLFAHPDEDGIMGPPGQRTLSLAPRNLAKIEAVLDQAGDVIDHPLGAERTPGRPQLTLDDRPSSVSDGPYDSMHTAARAPRRRGPDDPPVPPQPERSRPKPSRGANRDLPRAEEEHELRTITPSGTDNGEGPSTSRPRPDTKAASTTSGDDAPKTGLARDAQELRDRLPTYLLANQGAGPSKQKKPMQGGDIRSGLADIEPRLRNNADLANVQRKITEDVKAFLGKGITETLTVGSKKMELHVRAEFDWGAVQLKDVPAETGSPKTDKTSEQPDSSTGSSGDGGGKGKEKAEEGKAADKKADEEKTLDKAKPSGKTEVKSDSSSSTAQNRDINASAYFTAVPPLVAAVGVQAPAAASSAHSTKNAVEAARSSGIEVKALQDVEVPVRLIYTLLGSDGRAVTEEGHDNTATGTVEMSVPTSFKNPDKGNPLTHVDREPPAKFSVEEAFSVTPKGTDFYQQVADKLPKHLTDIDASGRRDLKKFLSDENIKKNLPAMAVFLPDDGAAARDLSEVGWVRSDPLLKGRKGWSRGNQPTKFEMRAVARQVRVLETLPDIQHTDSDVLKNKLTDKHTTSRTGGGSVHVGGGADTQAVFFSAGPAVSLSNNKQRVQDKTGTIIGKRSVISTGNATRYQMIYELQVRRLGHDPVILDGHIDAVQWTRQDRAERAGLVSPATDKAASPGSEKDGSSGADRAGTSGSGKAGTSESGKAVSGSDHAGPSGSDNAGPTGSDKAASSGADEAGSPPARKRYPPAHIYGGHSAGGAMIDDFDGGDRLRRSVADLLQKTPGHRWYHPTSSKFILPFSSPEFKGGTSRRTELILGRGEDLANKLSPTQLSQIVDSMLTPQGLTVQVVKSSLFHDYVTTVTLNASLDGIHEESPLKVAKASVGSKMRSKEGLDYSESGKTSLGLGVQARVRGPLGGALGTWIGNLGYNRIWSKSASLKSEDQQGAKRTHGDSLKEDGDLESRGLVPFSANLTITPTIRSFVRLNEGTRGITFGSPGRTVPKLVDRGNLPGNGQPHPDVVPLRLLVSENLVSDTPPDPLQITPQNRTPLGAKIYQLRPGASRAFDNAEIVAVLGAGHLIDSVRERLYESSGHDPLFAATDPNHPFKNPTHHELVMAAVGPDALKRNPSLFSGVIEIGGLYHGRRRADLRAAAGVSLTPRNPRPLSVAEYRKVRDTVGSSTGGGTSKGASNSVGLTSSGIAFAAGPTHGPGSAGVNHSPLGLFSAGLGLPSFRWGHEKGGEFTSVEKVSYENGKPVRKKLVWVDVDAAVVGESNYRSNFDKWRVRELFGGEPDSARTTNSGEAFRLPQSVLMWATDEHLAEMENRSPAPPTPVINEPDRVLPTPPSLSKSEKPSIGLGAVLTQIDLTDSIPELRKQLAANLDEATAARLLPASRLDIDHDNYGELRRFLRNANRSVNSSLNGGRITPLRLEDRLSGKTYYVTLQARFDGEPVFAGIEHASELSGSQSAKVKGTAENNRGHTLLTLSGSARAMGRLSEPHGPGYETQTTGHGGGAGSFGGGLDGEGTFGNKDRKDTATDEVTHKQSAKTSGPLGAHRVRLAFDIRIERGLGVGSDGLEVAKEVVAHDSRQRRDVTIVKLPEESFPPPSAGHTRYGEAGAIVSVPRSGHTAIALANWYRQPGRVALPVHGTHHVEHYFGDMAKVREAAERALSDGRDGSKLDSGTIAALRNLLTPAALKAGIKGMDAATATDLGLRPMEGGFEMSLPGGWGLEVHMRLRNPRLGSVSGRVEVDGKGESSHEHAVEVKSGNQWKVTALAPSGGGGVVHPGGANTIAEGRHPFGSLFAGTVHRVPITGQTGSFEAKGGAEKAKSTSPVSSDEVKTDDKVTQVNLYDADFRFVAKKNLGTWRERTGVADLSVYDAYAIRGNPDPAHPLPKALVTAATTLTEAGKTWDEALKKLLGLRNNPPHPPMSLKAIDEAWTKLDDAQTAADKAEAAWWKAFEGYHQQLEAAREQERLDRLPPEQRPSREAEQVTAKGEQAASEAARQREAEAERAAAEAARQREAEAERAAAEAARQREAEMARAVATPQHSAGLLPEVPRPSEGMYREIIDLIDQHLRSLPPESFTADSSRSSDPELRPAPLRVARPESVSSELRPAPLRINRPEPTSSEPGSVSVGVRSGDESPTASSLFRELYGMLGHEPGDSAPPSPVSEPDHAETRGVMMDARSGTVDSPVPLADLVGAQRLDVSDVDFVPLVDGSGDVRGVFFPGPGESGVVQEAFRRGAGEPGAYTTVMHHGEAGFSVWRKSDGQRVRLDEAGVVRLLNSTGLPNGPLWREKPELVVLSCRVADPALGDRLGKLADLLRQDDYHGDVRGPSTRVEVLEDGTIRVPDGSGARQRSVTLGHEDSLPEIERDAHAPGPQHPANAKLGTSGQYFPSGDFDRTLISDAREFGTTATDGQGGHRFPMIDGSLHRLAEAPGPAAIFTGESFRRAAPGGPSELPLISCLADVTPGPDGLGSAFLLKEAWDQGKPLNKVPEAEDFVTPGGPETAHTPAVTAERAVELLRRLDLTGNARTIGIERDEPSAERRYTWAGRDRVPPLPPLPELLELPRLVHSVWLRGALRTAEEVARFRGNLEHAVRVAGDRWRVVLWTDVTRDKLARALRPVISVRHETGNEDDFDLPDIAEMYGWVRDMGITLMNIQEAVEAAELAARFASDTTPDGDSSSSGVDGDSADSGGSSSPRGYGNVMDEILSHFGGVYLPPDHRVDDLGPSGNVVHTPAGWASDGQAAAMPKGHPAAPLHRQPEVALPTPELTGFAPATAIPVVPGTPSVMELSEQVLQALLDGLRAHPGNLNLAAVAALVEGFPQADEVWATVLTLLAARPELASQVHTVTLQEVDEAGVPRRVVLPPGAAELLHLADQPSAAANPGEFTYQAELIRPESRQSGTERTR
ncbi:hypothetical protein ORV05_01550 [Amycolatopsis cynarae]|uniref:Uncharacterized protein n=1 Tax=Amycolatopsis cynarae TaxID=2995223 RepID=A0ABY7B2W7_9PSEU|nr:hypothetical protein [Amycolatopsis sp. HUAS 11-8]WAL66531.1 hypothetical protein ORV05_01550 [Amycolatopsis sp. HUAS 11-8]